MSLVLIIDAPYPAELLNTNALRGQTRYLSAKTRPWKQLGRLLATGKLPVEPPVIITATFRFPDNRVRDTSNLFPTVKALVDGAVLAGALAKDDDRHVISTRMDREWPNGPARIILHVQSVSRGAPQTGLRATESDERPVGDGRAATTFRRAQNATTRKATT